MSIILQIWNNFYVISSQVLTKRKRNTRRVYQDSRPPSPKDQTNVQNPGLFRTVGYSEPDAYSETCQISMMQLFEKRLTAMIIFASYNYLRNISFSCLLVHKINMTFSMQV